jgi:hypothetical protein
VGDDNSHTVVVVEVVGIVPVARGAADIVSIVVEGTAAQHPAGSLTGPRTGSVTDP